MMKSYQITGFSKTILVISTLLLIAQIGSIIFIDSNSAVEHLAFQIFENCVMIIIVFIPAILDKGTNLRIPHAMEIAFVGFCFSALVLGDLFDFYGKFRWWDIVLHGISGIMLGILGYEIISTFISTEKCRTPVSPIFISIWVVCFALAIGAMWEIWEYMADGLFGLNSQEYLASSGTFDESTPLQGRDALTDTMEDMILDFVGAAIIGATSYHSSRRALERPSAD